MTVIASKSAKKWQLRKAKVAMLLAVLSLLISTQVVMGKLVDCKTRMSGKKAES